MAKLSVKYVGRCSMKSPREARFRRQKIQASCNNCQWRVGCKCTRDDTLEIYPYLEHKCDLWRKTVRHDEIRNTKI